MTLTLLAVSLNDRPLSQPVTAHFDSRGGTIGRADHNTMALPDPERHVSRLQAEVISQGGGFIIRNVGGANPITVAGRSVARGDSAPLLHGDEVRIGGYALQVDCNAQSAALDITRGRALLSAGPVALAQPLQAAQALAPEPAARAQQTPAPAPMPMPATGVPQASANPFADLLGSAAPSSAASSANDPFADLLGQGPLPPVRREAKPGPVVRRAMDLPNDPFAGLMPPPAGLPDTSAAFARAPAATSARLPDDFDPFGGLASPPLAAPAPGPSTRQASASVFGAASPFADLVPVAAPPSIDTMFDLGNSTADPLANFLSGPALGAEGAQGAFPAHISTDPLQALFANPAPHATAAPPALPQPDSLPAVNAAYAPPRALPAGPEPVVGTLAAASPRPAPAAAARGDPEATVKAPVAREQATPALSPPPLPATQPKAAPAASDSQDAARLWAALCEGAGIEVSLAADATEERMREVGRILRHAVDGTLRLIAVRTSTKQELRASVTVIQARGNNPLKFSPDAKSGLEYLLQPAMRGFLPGPAAMEDAMQDLVGHSIGTVAGMRAAIEGMLDRFAPAELQAKLSGKSMLDSVLPLHRKAKLWDLYLLHHDTIREDAREDFHTLFGKAFLAAYEQQIEQLQRAKPAP